MAEQPTTEPTQPATTQPVPAPSSAPDWKTSIPEDIRTAPFFKNVDSVETLARNYANAQKLIGANKIALPSDKATEEEWGAVFKALGRPEKPDQYKLERPKDVTIPVDEATEKTFREMAHKAGLTQRQMQAIYGDYLGLAQKTIGQLEETSAKMKDEAVADLKKTWGRDYDKNLKAVQEAAPRLFAANELEALKAKGLADDPAFIRAVHKMAVAMGEDKSAAGEPTGLGISASDAQRKINETLGDKNHPYWKSSHPAHKDAVAEISRLFSVVSGE